jgi:phage terminase large subunit
MEVTITTATNKIAGMRKMVKVVQGGQGAGKTFSILLILINHAISVPNQEIFIASAELSKMKRTVIKDYKKLLNWAIHNYGVQCNPKDNYILTEFANGSFINFISADKADIGKGLRSDVFFINEANKCNFEFYQAIASRSGNIYVDFNPDREFWVHSELLPENKTEFIKLTFQDNEALGENERESILDYKRKGYNEDGTIKNEYWANKWRVYGLGEIGIQVDAVFQNYSIIETENISLRELLGFGLDFGFSPDPCAMVAMYKCEGKVVFEEWIYKNSLSITDLRNLMRTLIEQNGYDADAFWQNTLILCDSASPAYIQELRQNGFSRAYACAKPIDAKKVAINELNANGFCVSSRSKNLIDELQKYTYRRDKDGKQTDVTSEKDDHLIDAMRYVYWHFRKK